MGVIYKGVYGGCVGFRVSGFLKLGDLYGIHLCVKVYFHIR